MPREDVITLKKGQLSIGCHFYLFEGCALYPQGEEKDFKFGEKHSGKLALQRNYLFILFYFTRCKLH